MPLAGSVGFLSFSWRKFGIRWAPCERPTNELVIESSVHLLFSLLPKFPSLAVFMISCRVQIRLAEDDHPDIRMEIDFTGLGARNSEIFVPA